MKPVFIHKQEPLVEPKFLTKDAQLVTYTRGDKLGKQHQWEVGTGHDTVHILVNNIDHNELLLVKQIRIPVLINQSDHSGEVIECCAGLVDKYNSCTDDYRIPKTAIEEMHEELGYLVPIKRLVPITTTLNAVGTKGSKSHHFYCEVADTDYIGQKLSPDEDIEAYSLDYIDVFPFLNEVTNTDSTTRMLLQWWLLNKIKE